MGVSGVTMVVFVVGVSITQGTHKSVSHARDIIRLHLERVSDTVLVDVAEHDSLTTMGMSRNIWSGAIFGPGRTKKLQYLVLPCHKLSCKWIIS